MKNVSRFGRVVQVRVMEARASGLFVSILENGRSGFIPRRQITWERRVSVPFVAPKAGEVLDALILEDKNNRITLSLRQLCDPWQAAIDDRKYKYGQWVIGEVVSVRHFGAYVQLEPGIDAIIYPGEASFLAQQNIDDILWVGDKVEAEIINLDLHNHTIELSLIAVQRKRAFMIDVDQQAKELLTQFGANVSLPLVNDTNGKRAASVPVSSKGHGPEHVIRKLTTILVIDDDQRWRNQIQAGLARRFRTSVDIATNKDEALGKLSQGTPYDLVIIDINLENDDGTELAQTIRETNPELPILLVSTAPLQSVLNQYPHHLIEDEFLFAQKDNDIQEISEKIVAMSTGLVQTTQLSLSEENTWIQYLGLQAFSEQPVAVILDEILKWLQGETGAAACLVIRLDKILREIAITTAYPALPPEKIKMAQDGLYYSPARQILEENSILNESILDFRNERYKNFFQGIDFQSYLGIPIRTPDQNTATYGLVILDTDPLSFSGNDSTSKGKVTVSRFAAHFLSVTLERASIFDYMRRYEAQYSLGQLTSDLIHETSNKFNALDTIAKTMESHWEQRPDGSSLQATQAWLEKIGKPIQNLKELSRELNEVFESYSQQTKAQYSSVDVNLIVDHVLHQLARTAKQKGIRLYEKKAKYVPPVLGAHIGIKQVVLNLVLNAIQMFDLHQQWLLKISKQTMRPVPTNVPGMIIVQTRYIEDDKKYPVEIRLIDSGPGIHYRNWENIFMQGYSGRGGSGLGLYISRNLIQRMGGKLLLVDSILFSGSAFAIRLPAATDEEK